MLGDHGWRAIGRKVRQNRQQGLNTTGRRPYGQNPAIGLEGIRLRLGDHRLTKGAHLGAGGGLDLVG